MKLAKGDDIQERLLTFAVGIIKITTMLPNSNAGKHTAKQLLRSGTSPAPNYAEARGAESKRDFIHKLGIVLKELNESGIWLEIIRRSEMTHSDKIASLIRECEELRKIISASIQTAKQKQ